MKNPIEAATFRLAAQCLNQLRYRLPQKTEQDKKNTVVHYKDNDDKEEQKEKEKEKEKKKKTKKERDTKRNFPLSNFSYPLLMILHPCRSKTAFNSVVTCTEGNTNSRTSGSIN
jgi:hypothetical protein